MEDEAGQGQLGRVSREASVPEHPSEQIVEAEARGQDQHPSTVAGWLAIACGLAMPLLAAFFHFAHGPRITLLMFKNNLFPFLVIGATLLTIAAPFFAIVAIFRVNRTRVHLRETIQASIGISLFLLACLAYWHTGYLIEYALDFITEPESKWNSDRLFMTQSYIDNLTENRLYDLKSELFHLSKEDEGHRLPALADVPGRLMHGAKLEHVDWSYVSMNHPRMYEMRLNRALRGMKQADDWSWLYLGYEIRNDEQMQAFADIYKARVGTGAGFDEDVPSAAFPDGLMRRLNLRMPELEPGSKRLPLPSELGRADVPVLISRVEHNGYRGAHVLFLDGHVEFIEYPGRWPMTRKTVALLNELDGMGKAPGANQ